jgi:hypothetical protein
MDFFAPYSLENREKSRAFNGYYIAAHGIPAYLEEVLLGRLAYYRVMPD